MRPWPWPCRAGQWSTLLVGPGRRSHITLALTGLSHAFQMPFNDLFVSRPFQDLSKAFQQPLKWPLVVFFKGCERPPGPAGGLLKGFERPSEGLLKLFERMFFKGLKTLRVGFPSGLPHSLSPLCYVVAAVPLGAHLAAAVGICRHLVRRTPLGRLGPPCTSRAQTYI